MPRSHPIAFPLLGALAYAGAVVAYTPLLTLLLPLHVERVAGASRFGMLAVTMSGGAVVAGVSNIVFGWISDHLRERNIGRRPLIAAGLAATLIAYAAVARTTTPAGIVTAIMLFQAALNAMLAPLMALLAEEIPDRQKGLIGGLLAGAPAVATLFGLLLVGGTTMDLGWSLGLTGLLATGCSLPLLLSRSRSRDPCPAPVGPLLNRRDLVFSWASRLLVQIAGNVLFVYLLYIMEAVSAGERSSAAVRVGGLLVVANIVPVPVSILLGRWSDRVGRRLPFLLTAATAAAAGLVAMGVATDRTAAAAGFCLYSAGWGSFLALQTGFVMQLLPNPERRGRDLGLLNLANTLPVLAGQALAWRLATPHHVAPLLFTLAALTLAGGAAMFGVREGRRKAGPGRKLGVVAPVFERRPRADMRRRA